MRNIGGNVRGWQLMGVSPKALSLMPAKPLGEGGNSAMLSSLGQVATSKSDILEAEISTSLRLPPPPSLPFPCQPSIPETHRVTSALLSSSIEIGFVSLHAPKVTDAMCRMILHQKGTHMAIGD